jgi:hypothetical protein
MKNREFLTHIDVDKDVIGTTVNMKKQWLKGQTVFDRRCAAPWVDAWIRVVAVQMESLEPKISIRNYRVSAADLSRRMIEDRLLE